MSDILIIGLGHVGQPLAVKLADAGYTVYGVDTNPHVIDCMLKGGSHVQEPGLSEAIKSHLNKGLFVGPPDPLKVGGCKHHNHQR